MGHENVDTFQSGMIVDEMFKAGYRHILVKVKPLDVGIPIGRPRRLLGNISILYTYIWIYIYIYVNMSRMRDRRPHSFCLPAEV